jgi:hypothetical protein
MRTRPPAWPATLLIVATALACALVLPAGAAAAETGSIAGSISLEGGGLLNSLRACAWPKEGTEIEARCALAESTGEYRITGLAPGEYIVKFWNLGPENYVWEYYGGARTLAAATPVTVVAETVTGGIEALLETGATISGTVTAAATGSVAEGPVAGVEVCAKATLEGPPDRCAKTEAAGGYAITGLAPGEYDVYFHPEATKLGLLAQAYPARAIHEAPEPVDIAGREPLGGIDAVLQPGGQVFGTVRSTADSAPVAGVRVCLSEAESPLPIACVNTPASGGYRFFGVWTGLFKVVFSPELADLYGAEAIRFTEAEFEPAVWAALHDAYPTQWFDGGSSFAGADPIAEVAPAIVTGVDGTVPAPPMPPAPPVPPVTAPPAPPAAAVVTPKKPLICKRGLVKRKVQGKPRCVRRHKPKPHHHRRFAAR